MANCVFGVVASFVCCVLLSFQRYPGVALGMRDVPFRLEDTVNTQKILRRKK